MAATVVFSNFASTTAVTAVSSGATSITVRTGTGALFPSTAGGNWFYCVLTDSLVNPTQREIVKVTTISGDVMTITRGQDGTTAQVFSLPPFVELRLVNQALLDLQSGAGGGVSSFNTRTGAVTLSSADVTGALGFSPVQSFNGRTGIVTLSSADVTGALGFTPLSPANNLSDLSNVATARTNLGLGAFALIGALTGPITSNSAGLTAIASQTGTGTTFAMQTNPSFAGSFSNGTAGARGAVETTGSFGGAFTMLDGTTRLGMWSQSSGTELHFFTGMTATDTPASKERMALTTLSLLFTGANVAKGGAPEEGFSTAISQSVPAICLKDGSSGSPNTTSVYNTPVLYLERHTNNSSTTTYAGWSNLLLKPTFLIETVAYSAEAGDPVGVAARTSSTAIAPASTQPLMAFAGQAESNAPAGQKNWDCWGANFIAKFGSGNQPSNLIGMEADLIPASAAAAGKKPGTVGASNFLGVWAVVDGRIGGSGNTAFYSFGLSGNWEFGVVLDNVVHTFLTTSSTATLVNGIDFSTCSFSGYAFISPSIALTGGGAILSASPSAGIGYTTGAGGTVTQLTNKGTSVTLNKICGEITMNNAALGAGVKVSFFCNNSTVASTDMVNVAISSVPGGTPGAYRADCTLIAAGTFLVCVENITGGALSETPIVRFQVTKMVNA